jgi:endonuclease/exonuclease/phosphatase family metal-dependent hydrolase
MAAVSLKKVYGVVGFVAVVAVGLLLRGGSQNPKPEASASQPGTSSSPAQPPAKPSTSSTPSTPAAAPQAPSAPARGGQPAVTTGAVDPATIRFGLREPLPKTPGSIRITTFNIENLFDDVDDPKISGSIDDADMTKPVEHRKAAAEAIIRSKADVVALQEIESKEALEWFMKQHLADAGFAHVASLDAGDGRGIEQSVISKFPIVETRNFKGMKLGGRQPDVWGDGPGAEVNENAGKPFEFTRSPLLVTIEVPSDRISELLAKAGKTDPVKSSYKVTLLNVHLKSGRHFDLQRAAEVRGVLSIIETLKKETPGINVLVLGDFNAVLTADSLKQFPPAGVRTIFETRAPRDEKTVTHSSGRCIDHIWYTSNMEKELVMTSRHVLGLPTRAEGADWRTTPAPAGYSSDHFPVSIDVMPVEK